eukprot:scaffold86575_cov62-Attheya_sp.AAC.3
MNVANNVDPFTDSPKDQRSVLVIVGNPTQDPVGGTDSLKDEEENDDGDHAIDGRLKKTTDPNINESKKRNVLCDSTRNAHVADDSACGR